jgi:hypothetical protein
MTRALFAALLVLAAGCQLPPERPLRPLPEDGPAMSYADLVTRARIDAAAANEAFYVDRWADLEDAAKGIEQVARFFAKATDVPAKHKDTLPVEAGDLGKEAAQLRDAAKARDVQRANEILQRLNLKIRELRLES